MKNIELKGFTIIFNRIIIIFTCYTYTKEGWNDEKLNACKKGCNPNQLRIVRHRKYGCKYISSI